MSDGRNERHRVNFSRPSDADGPIATLAGRQGGHVTREQLRALGLSPRAIQHRRVRGLLIPVHRGVYAVGRLPTSPHDRAHGALLAIGEQSALAGASAMALYGLRRRWPEPLELVSTTDRRLPTLTIRQSKTLLRRDVVLREGLRVTSPARTLLDVVPRLDERRVTRAINELRMEQGLTLETMEDVVARNPRHPGVKGLRVHLARGQAEPTRSQLEDAFLELVRCYELPTPQVNVHVAGFRVDALFPDHGVIVELDGWATHGTRQAFKRDRRQDAEILAATGIPTIRLSYEDTTEHARDAAERLAAILNARG